MGRNRPPTEPTPPVRPDPDQGHSWPSFDLEACCLRCGLRFGQAMSTREPCADRATGRAPGNLGSALPGPHSETVRAAAVVAAHTAHAVPRRGRLIPAPDTPLMDCPSNLDLTRPDHKVLAFNALSAADVTVTTGGSIQFTANHWLVHPVSMPDPETGEISQYTRTVFLCRDGTTVASCSDIVPHRLAAALSLFTPDDWRVGVGFELRSRPRKRGPGNYHDLRCITVPGGQDDA